MNEGRTQMGEGAQEHGSMLRARPQMPKQATEDRGLEGWCTGKRVDRLSE